DERRTQGFEVPDEGFGAGVAVLELGDLGGILPGLEVGAGKDAGPAVLQDELQYLGAARHAAVSGHGPSFPQNVAGGVSRRWCGRTARAGRRPLRRRIRGFVAKPANPAPGLGLLRRNPVRKPTSRDQELLL